VSLSWRERVEVGFYPDRLVLVRGKATESIALAPAAPPEPRWRAGLDALAGLEALTGAEVTVVLSSFFVRYALVPATEALVGAGERLAFARHCLARVYGSVAEGWVVRLSGEVACGVELRLIDGLRSALAARGNRLRSVQPRLMAAFNRHRRQLGEQPSWFVDVEPGLASLALLASRRWQSLRSVKLRAESWEDELPGLLAREACFVDSPADCPRIVHAAP
jgi:hypothetical protein